MASVLRKYLPEKSIESVEKLLDTYKVQLKIVNENNKWKIEHIRMIS